MLQIALKFRARRVGGERKRGDNCGSPWPDRGGGLAQIPWNARVRAKNRVRARVTEREFGEI
jgi:hypothetical protein